MRLFVEGDLDQEVLFPVLAGRAVVEAQRASKDSLPPRVRTERERLQAQGVASVRVFYLRDRDFDHDPPADVSRPVPDAPQGKPVLGWRWCRHSIECYLCDPLIVTEAMEWERREYEDALQQAAGAIRYYQAARWAIASARQSLPPRFELKTSPDGLADFALPGDLTETGSAQWAVDHVAAFRSRVVPALAEPELRRTFSRRNAQFEAVTQSVNQVLLWFSGKDLMAALAGWLAQRGIPSAGAFRVSLRDWIRANPERTLALLAEWQGLIQITQEV
jgi:hypothetical protein